MKRHTRKDGSVVESHNRAVTQRPSLERKLKDEAELRRKSNLLQSFFGDNNDTT